MRTAIRHPVRGRRDVLSARAGLTRVVRGTVAGQGVIAVPPSRRGPRTLAEAQQRLADAEEKQAAAEEALKLVSGRRTSVRPPRSSGCGSG